MGDEVDPRGNRFTLNHNFSFCPDAISFLMFYIDVPLLQSVMQARGVPGGGRTLLLVGSHSSDGGHCHGVRSPRTVTSVPPPLYGEAFADKVPGSTDTAAAASGIPRSVSLAIPE